MNKQAIIQAAAKKSDISLPLDTETQEFSERLLRSLDDGIKWANGEPNNLIKIDAKKWLEDLQRRADEI